MRSILALASALLVAACGAPGSAPGPLRVASDLDNAPFAYLDADGRPAGRDVEMMERLAARLGLALAWERRPFEELLPAAERGEVDVVCATLGVTEERARRVLFTRPYFETQIALVVRAGPAEPQRLGHLRGLLVAGGAGTTSERAVRLRLPAARGVFTNEQGLAAAERLLRRDVDAVALDGPAAERLVLESQGRLRRLGEDLGPERYALVLPRDREPLRAQLDEALLALAGELRALDRRHGLAR